MIRPHICIHLRQGYIGTIYPPMQWNEKTSTRKMLIDVREWLHNHHPSWERAMVHLTHHRGINTHTEIIHIDRRQIL